MYDQRIGHYLTRRLPQIMPDLITYNTSLDPKNNKKHSRGFIFSEFGLTPKRKMQNSKFQRAW